MTTYTTIKTDRYTNRAPKGGAISLVNGRFYLGGRFMPKTSVEFKPGPACLVGSSRQIAWANRLRNQAIDRLTIDLATRRLFLNDSKIIDEPGVRRAIRRDSAILHGLMTERSASRIIEIRAQIGA